MKILNSEKEDYHIHSLNYSDGLNTIDEIVIFAGKIGMKKIAITDHSLVALEYARIPKKCYRSTIQRWKNVHNRVEVIFGVEADLLNAKGDVCMQVSTEDKKFPMEEKFVILSYHDHVFRDQKTDVVKGFIKAMERYHDKINMLGHVCNGLNAEDALQIIKVANKHKIPLELNCAYFKKNPDEWDVLLKNADQIYVNSDGHTLADIRDFRKEARAILKAIGYLK